LFSFSNEGYFRNYFTSFSKEKSTHDVILQVYSTSFAVLDEIDALFSNNQEILCKFDIF
jgi:Cdc6-like AAA superfamily ATPase